LSVATIHIGLGVIGLRLCETGLREGHYRPVAAVDPAPALAGRDLGELLGQAPSGVVVRASLAEALAAAAERPIVALHATRSTIVAVRDELVALVAAGCDVVSTCEELAVPDLADRTAAASIDAAARSNGRRIVGAGINPGFAMDLLPLAIMQATIGTRTIEIRRFQDPLKRRAAFQRKVGVGRTRADCEADIARGVFGHVGLRESAYALARGLGWTIARGGERLTLIDAADGASIDGVHQTYTAHTTDERTIRLRFRAIRGMKNDLDAYDIDGDPPIRVRIPGGLSGDQATANLALAAVLRLAPLAPGLRSGAELAIGVPRAG
jgi:4-hydroxy-tetrahydrodipicolinate reductase